MIAVYDMSRYLASFEFFSWLVMVQADGATSVCIDDSCPKLKNFTREDVAERVRSIIEPGSALAGLPWFRQQRKTPLVAIASQLGSWYRSGRRFRRLRSPKPPVTCDFTVTLRTNPGAKSRNSNREVWLRFAERIGAKVIDDYYAEPIHLHDRYALYAGAKMNFGVCNGPVFTLSLTEYPVAMFANTQSARNSNTRFGQPPDQNYPWMLRNQHLIWRPDDSVDDLMRVFDELRI